MEGSETPEGKVARSMMDGGGEGSLLLDMQADMGGGLKVRDRPTEESRGCRWFDEGEDRTWQDFCKGGQ